MLATNEFELEELTNKLEILLIETKGSCIHVLFFDADDFTSLEESALVSLLKRNDLQMEEVNIWDYVIKWGIAHTSTLPTNLDDWTKENFLTLKTTLQQCLPHIRYQVLKSFDYRITQKPRESFSTIISEEYIAEISAWIDRKTNAYKFEFILRGTRDGFAPQTFWNICQGYTCTVVLLKVKGTDEIIEG
ncbi:hypothetical protein Glove_213g99 [Diversispora epigaea]|uniref:TLDc domain-containing protein n=1 Tax=Diversispora epigaea TaxID=1348612 RepID=A0A397II50_9GLOM|nr:hypothetical protein Glove_213g99 [Diversispora epigaea]